MKKILNAKLATEITDLSPIGMLAEALGKMTGAMVADTELDMGNTDITLITLQCMYSDGFGTPPIVCGTSPHDEGGTFALMADGSVEIAHLRVSDGDLVFESDTVDTVAENASDVLQHCEAYVNASELSMQMVIEELERLGYAQESDQFQGSVVVNVEEALRNTVASRVAIVLMRDGKTMAGFVCTVGPIKSGVPYETAVESMVIRVMDKEEIEAEKKKVSLGTGQSAFPQTIGQA